MHLRAYKAAVLGSALPAVNRHSIRTWWHSHLTDDETKLTKVNDFWGHYDLFLPTVYTLPGHPCCILIQFISFLLTKVDSFKNPMQRKSWCSFWSVSISCFHDLLTSNKDAKWAKWVFPGRTMHIPLTRLSQSQTFLGSILGPMYISDPKACQISGQPKRPVVLWSLPGWDVTNQKSFSYSRSDLKSECQ